MDSRPATAREARQRLYETIRQDEPFDVKTEKALEIGEQYLGVDNGHLTRIDTETDHWEVIASTDSSDSQFPIGSELDLGTTYCRRTLGADDPVALHDAPSQGWDDDIAFETHGLHCYHGTTLYLDEEPYGTVCFVDEDPREEPFRVGETMFAELITRLLERELEREYHRQELTRRTNLVNVLNRVLRHNLRNDMTVIRGRTQSLADRVPDDATATTALRKIDELIQLAEKARDLEEIVVGDHERMQTTIPTLVEGVVADISSEFPAASFTVDASEDVTAPVLPSFERAVRELVENAAKHGGETPTVAATVEAVPNAVEITVGDDGPGLSAQEREVLKEGVETPLIHGSGLGLWLVHWIVTSHDGTVEATVTDEGTSMTVSVPRSPVTEDTRNLADLRKARDQFQAAFERAFDAQIIIDDDLRIIEANPQASSLFGVTRVELRGRSLQEFLPDEFDLETAWTEFREHGADRDTVTIVDADSTQRTVEYSATADIVPGQHLVIYRDVSDIESPRTMYTSRD
jgi:PAS domain S-box-containing protein